MEKEGSEFYTRSKLNIDNEYISFSVNTKLVEDIIRNKVADECKKCLHIENMGLKEEILDLIRYGVNRPI